MRATRQFLGTDDHQDHGTDQRHFGQANIKHLNVSPAAISSLLGFHVDGWPFRQPAGWPPTGRSIGIGVSRAVLHAVLEALTAPLQVGSRMFLSFLVPEHQNHDEQHDRPVPDRKRAHENLPRNCKTIFRRGL